LDLNFWRRLLYRQQGERLVYLALYEGNLAGFDMFYFREDEPSDVIHEAFIGVSERFRGRGISSALRRSAVEHFGGAGLRAISSRISQDNDRSLQSARSVGFEIVPNSSAERGGGQLLLRRDLR